MVEAIHGDPLRHDCELMARDERVNDTRRYLQTTVP
jgi:hypothetical protein